MTFRHLRTAGPALAIALAAALSGPSLADDDASRVFSLSQDGSAAPDRSPLAISPCLDAPGCGREQTPLMPEAAQRLEGSSEDPSAVPLPAALALMGAAMAAFAMLRRRPTDG